MSKVRVPAPAEVRAFAVTVDLPTAGRCFGLGRDASYRLARLGDFPVPVLRLGASLRITRASLLAALGLSDATPVAPTQPLTKGTFALVSDLASDTTSDTSTLSDVA